MKTADLPPMRKHIQIPDTTLCCVDCIHHELAIAALQKSMAACSFERALFLTDRNIEAPGIETVLISPLRSRDEYSAFILHELARYIETGFVLLVQWDGYVVNPSAWTEEFLEYDYIGAVWSQHKDAFRVGNGGFSLRSRKLLQATQAIPIAGENQNEDELICRKHRPMLESSYGIRFAPEPVAEQFSFEISYPRRKPFGFHALFNMWLVMEPHELESYIANMSGGIVGSLQFLRLGINFRDLRQFGLAEAISRRILAVNPEHPDARLQLDALTRPPAAPQSAGRNEACPCGSGQRYKNCCGKVPVTSVARGSNRAEDIQWLLSVAMKHHQANHLLHAGAIYKLVLHEQPDNAIAMQYLGVISYQNEKHEEAAGLIKRAIEIQPAIPDFHNNLGLVFHAMGELGQAMECYRQAIALNANYAQAWNNLGLALEAGGRPAEAIPAYERAIALQPEFAQAHWNLSLVLLAIGDFSRGWREYEWRLKTPELAGEAQRFPQPAWDGNPLSGKTILLHPEQGFGDAIQFIRYVPRLTSLGGNIMVEVQPALKRLFAQIPGIERVIVKGEPLPHFDVHCPLLSLPFHFGATLDNLPAEVPYLSADPHSAELWRQRIPDTHGARMKIGLVWAGNPKHKNDRNRSIGLDQFNVLGDIPSLAFFSLQKGSGANQAGQTALNFHVHDLMEYVEDFADTASLIGQLDLVLCVDTSVAHLAGAMGKPTWVLLPFASDWRWLQERSDSPWYPSMRLFRQRKIGDWGEVLLRVHEALAEKAA